MMTVLLAAVVSAVHPVKGLPVIGEEAEWIAAATPSGEGTDWFCHEVVNNGDVVCARWTTTALGTYDAYVNGLRVGEDFLKPGYTHPEKTRLSFSHDVRGLMNCVKGATNVLSACVGPGWWRDGILRAGKQGAFYGRLEIEYANGRREVHGTRAGTWRAGAAGPVVRAGIWEGETYDARLAPDFGKLPPAVRDTQFKGEILPSRGAEVCLRYDRAMTNGFLRLRKGETKVVDFGQNCAAVPEFTFRAKSGTRLVCLPGEMLNDAGKGERGCDGPTGSVYRANLRIPEKNMRLEYVFSGKGTERYLPRQTFFGYRYLSLTATDDVEIERVLSVPVTSVRREHETGRLETGDAGVNRLIANAYWSMLSNFLSVPTDCPQRNERLGWAGDAQVFAETAAYCGNVLPFYAKWMRDMRDTALPDGGFACIAPPPVWRKELALRTGWSDAGVIVPYVMWRHFGDLGIVRENWSAMDRFMDRIAAAKWRMKELPETKNFQFGDWLALENFDYIGLGQWEQYESGKWRRTAFGIYVLDFYGACFWLSDARMMRTMAAALGRNEKKYAAMEKAAFDYFRTTFLDGGDGLLEKRLRRLQTPNLFALKLGVLADAAREGTKRLLRENFAKNGGRNMTGFLGMSVIMDALTENGMADVAWDLFLSHGYPSWLYEVDQGATTIWERWNSYTKDKGFGPVEMNSFNHYAFGSVVAWIWKTVAGIAPDPEQPGFRRILMAPKPDRRLGFVKARYPSAAGVITSEWKYEGDRWIWDFTIPKGATARVQVPGEDKAVLYSPGSHRLTRRLP